MDYPLQELHFLDLTDANEEERSFLQTALFTTQPHVIYPVLPWNAHPDLACSPAEWRPAPYAVAPIPHPTLRGVFLPPPMYAPAPPALGLVPTVAAPGEPTDGPLVAAGLDGDDCNSSATTQNAPSPAGQETMPQESHSAGTGIHTSSVYAEPPLITVPPQIPTSVPTQPSVMTTMYHLSHVPLPNVYVSNVTANVNVHGYVGTPYGTYQHISPQPVYTGEVSHESAPTTSRNGRDSRRLSSKRNNKRIDGQFSDRSSVGRHSQEVIPTQPPPIVDSPPTVNSNLPPQNYTMYPPISPMHHGYPTQYYNTPAPSHPAHHLPHHPSPQHGTPIYISGHPSAMYTPTLYGTYPPHQAGGPPIMAFPTAMQSTPVPTTENSVEVSGTEEAAPVPNKEVELDEVNLLQSQKQPVAYLGEPVQEICDLVITDQNNTKPVSYQQQQSEEEEYNQANLVNTVVVSNSNIVSEPLSFTDVKKSGVDEDKNRNLPSSGHQNLSKDAVPSSFVPEKNVSNSEVVDDSVLNQPSRANIGETNASVNRVVSDVNSKRDKTIVNSVTLSSAVAQHDKSHMDIKPSVSCVDVPIKSENVSSTTNPQPVSISGSVQHQTSGQNVTNVAATSHAVEVPAPQISTPTTATSKSWASLFKGSSSPGEPGMMIAGATVSGTSGGIKPLAAVKPFQNAVPVSSDLSRRVSEGYATPVSSTTSSIVSSVIGGKNFPNLPSTSPAEDPYLYRLGEFLLKYQLDHKTLSLQPRGLTNRSNWCYINSTLQALLACPPFYNLMKSLQTPLATRRTTKSTTPIIDSMVQFVSEFVPLSAAARPKDRKEKAVRKDDGSIEDQCGAPFEPNYIYKMLNNIRSDTFKVEGRQEDAEEFLGCLLNALNDEMLELIKLVEEPATKSTLSNGDIATNGDTSAQSQDEDDTEWKVMGPKNKGSITRRADFGRTPISDIFRGQLRSRVQRAGDQSTDNVQPFFTLQLDIERAQSVKDALELLVGRDQLEGVTCSRTNQEVEAWQQVTLEELPLVLLLHLKWFDYKMDGASKIVKNVEFPIDLKVDQKLMSSTKKYGPKQRQYKLFAVVYHDGKEATKGHYVTDVYHVGYGGWVRYDDSVVKAVQEINVLHPRGPRVPYLLYYRRCDTIGSTQPSSAPDKTR